MINGEEAFELGVKQRHINRCNLRVSAFDNSAYRELKHFKE